MHYCYSHPEKSATYFCHHCKTHTCDDCSCEQDYAVTQCFFCDGELESLGSGSSAQPFWRRLDLTFKYAMHKEVMIFIIILAFLSAVFQFIPFAFIFDLIIAGAFIKYCLVCLERTAMGKMSPPEITESYENGLSSLFQLLFIIIAIGGACLAAVSIFGVSVGSLLSVLLVCALPAAIITLALTESVIAALNPASMFRIITAIGLPYGLLLAFIMVMTSSVALIHTVMGSEFYFITSVLQNFVSNFYFVVMFHMMGYMIFQYQGKLGFAARDDEADHARNKLEQVKAKIAMLIRQGDFEKVLPAYVKAINENPEAAELSDACFEFLLASNDNEQLIEFGSFYLEKLIKLKKHYQLQPVYRRLVNILPNFMPDTADLRFSLAQQLHKGGDDKESVRLLTDLERAHPTFAKLPKSYAFLAEILETIPGKESEAKAAIEKSRQYSDKLQKEQEARQKKQNAEESAPKEEKAPPKPVHQVPDALDKYDLSGLSLVPKEEG